MIRVQKVRLYPDQTMQKILDNLCDYRKVANIQHNLIHKFTTKLVSDYDKIVIEDLDVKKMQMTHVASKGLQRSLFGYFRQVLTYKAGWHDKEVVLADKYYPSTQRCSDD